MSAKRIRVRMVTYDREGRAVAHFNASSRWVAILWLLGVR